MERKDSRGYIPVALIAAAIIISVLVLSNAFLNRNRNDDIIYTTGLGSMNFESDLIVWSASFTRVNADLQSAYADLHNDQKVIDEYLRENGVEAADFVFSSIDIFKEYDMVEDRDGNRRQVFNGYSLRQSVTVESGDVGKVEDISRGITGLINRGLELYSQPPQYYYTKLSELKMELIERATEDAKERAQIIASRSGAKMGKLKNASMGVFQIIAQNSNEDYSWDGAFNTSSKQKTATITMRLQFGIR